MLSISQTVGHRIRTYRQFRGLTQEELAEKAEVHPTYIGQVERGEKNLTVNTLEKILNALDLSFSEFFQHIDAQKGNDVAGLCYEIIHRQKPKKQEEIFRLLTNIEKMLSD